MVLRLIKEKGGTCFDDVVGDFFLGGFENVFYVFVINVLESALSFLFGD